MDRGKLDLRLPTPGIPIGEFSTGEFPFVDGVYSRFFPSRKGPARKEILAGAAVCIDGQWFAPGGIARAIAAEIPKDGLPGPAGSPQWQLISPPWWGWGILQEGVLLDLRRAFESILRSFGVREGAPGMYFSRSPIWIPPQPFWEGPGEKLVLRILPSAGLSRQLRLWKRPGEIIKIRKPPIDFRPWGTVMVALHGIAARARALGAIYWNVDGGILPADRAPEFIGYIESLGLSIRERGRGPALALGRGIYAVGGLISRPYRAGAMGREQSDGAEDFRQWAAAVLE